MSEDSPKQEARQIVDDITKVEEEVKEAKKEGDEEWLKDLRSDLATLKADLKALSERPNPPPAMEALEAKIEAVQANLSKELSALSRKYLEATKPPKSSEAAGDQEKTVPPPKRETPAQGGRRPKNWV